MVTELAPRPVMDAITTHMMSPPGMEPRRVAAPAQAVGLAVATLEALLGRRGLHQLRPRLSRAAFVQLVGHVDSGLFDRSVLGRLRTQMPTPIAVEATARISVNARWLAVTVRLDRAESWQCSDLTVLGAPRF